MIELFSKKAIDKRGKVCYNYTLYQNALDEYDKVGPVIASKIVVDEDRKNVAMDMLNKYLGR